MGMHYVLPRGADMAAAVADLIFLEHGNQLQNVTLLVPTTRAADTLTHGFLAHKKTAFLPRILPLDPNAADIFLADATPVITPYHRLFFLAQQVTARAKAEELSLTPEQALTAAQSLAHLLDTFLLHHITAAYIEAELHAQNLPEHLTQNLLFVEILLATYPAYLAANNLQDGITYQQAQFTAWQEKLTAQNEPIYAVGFQDTTPAGAVLLEAISATEHGHFVAPPLHDITAELDALTPLHPDYTLRHLLHDMNISVDELKPLTHTTSAPNYSLAVADDPHQETELAALMLKEAYHNGQRAMLVTPNPQFGQHVNAHLKAWGLAADDSAGVPFAQTAEGSFLLLISDLAAKLTLTSLVALTQHPLLTLETDATQAFDALALRGLPPTMPTLEGYAKKLVRAQFSFPKPSDVTLQNAQTTLDAFAAGLTPLIAASQQMLLDDYVALLRDAYTALSGTELPLELQDILLQLSAETELLRLPQPQHINASLAHVLQQATKREGVNTNLLIRGPVQARYEHGVERLVLANLTAEDWPKVATPDPWLNSQLAAALHLPPKERALGLGVAHFWALSHMGQEVMYLRSNTVQGLAVPAAPCLSDMLSAFSDAECAEITSRGDAYKSYLMHLFGATDQLHDYSPEATLTDVIQPSEEWSASFIEGLMACPYKTRLERFYKLTPPKAYNEEEDARDKGTLFHTCLQAFFVRPERAPHDLPAPFSGLITPQNIQHALAHFMIIADVYLRFIAQSIAPVWRTRLEVQAKLFLEKLIDIQTENRTPKLFEARGKLNFAGIVLTGQADRMDINTAENSVHIIDYKTGAPPSKKDIFSGKKPQLLVESILASHGAFGADMTTPTALEYWQLGTGKTDFNTKVYALTEEDISDATDGLKSLIEEHVSAGDFAAVPGGAGRLADGICTYCEFSAICRFKNRSAA